MFATENIISASNIANGQHTNGNGSNGHEQGAFHVRKRMVWIALFANVLIALIKFGAGMIGGQAALISESIHSFADSLNSGFLIIGLQKGSRSADKTHPFGYGLETTLWAMLASMTMLALAGWSIYVGVQRIFTPQAFQNYPLAIAILIASVFIELLALRVATRAILHETGQKNSRNPVLNYIKAYKSLPQVTSPTTRFVFYEDSLALLGSFVAVVAITISQYAESFGLLSHATAHIPDAIASILIGLMILTLSIYLFTHNSRGLTGLAASPEQEMQIRQIVLGIHGVSKIHDLKTTDYGMSGVVATLRIEVGPEILVKDVDDLTERIRERITQRIRNVKQVVIEVQADESDEEWSEAFYRLISKGETQSVLKQGEARILRNIYDFTKAVASDVMIPRTAVECIESTETLHTLIDMFEENGHTRLLVYGEDLDEILGVIHAKDVFPYIKSGDWPNQMDVPLLNLARPIQVYPENKSVSDLLEDFKRKKISIAMVADEHGGFAGIVTLEDLLEEIVGDLWDEYDEEEIEIQQPEPNKLICSGRCDIDELNEKYNFHIPNEEFNTIGGFVFGLLGQAPVIGDEVEFEDLKLKVLAVDNLRIDQVEIESPVALELVSEDSQPIDTQEV